MGFKLTISDTLEVPVRFTVNDGGKTVPHSFSLLARRMDQQQLRDTLQDNARLTREVLHERVTGWRGQRLVIDDVGEPAAFGPEAFDCLLSLAGMESIVLSAYLGALVAADTSAGRAKN